MSQLHLQVLEPFVIKQVVDEALQVLENPGVRVHHAGALDLLEAAGALVNRNTQVARIPAPLVEMALKTAPAQFLLYSLDGKPIITYGSNTTYFDPGSAAVTILDHAAGRQRAPLTGDLVQFVKLVETLQHLDAQSTAFICQDVPPQMGDLYRLYVALNYMKKPIVTGAFTRAGWNVMWELLSVVAGSGERLEERPLAIFDICPSPPLLWSELTCQNLMDCAARRVPAELVSMPLAGVAAPVTLLGSVVQHTAENLSGLVIHQQTRAGAPIVWGGAPAVTDMRHGSTPMGDPATWLIDLATVEVGRYLGLPTHTYMGSTDGKMLDMQAGAESMGGVLLAILVGASMVSGVGMIDFLRCQSLEKLIVDAELIGYARRFGSGMTIREDTLGLDQLQTNPHQADFLERTHTRDWFAKELYLPSPVVDRGSLEQWEMAGGMAAHQRAHDLIPRLLKKYQPNGVPAEVRRELYAIVIRTARQWGLDHLPKLEEEENA